MKKFLVLCRAPLTSFQEIRNASREERQRFMDNWLAWEQRNAASIVQSGAPLGKSLRVSTAEVAPMANDLGSFSIFQAESSEALAAILKDYPFLRSAERFLEIVEIGAMPTA